jgi:uncharacterized protein DUF4845
MRKQQGLTVSGFVLWAIVVIALVVLGIKVGPAYFEYYAIQRTFKTLANDPLLQTGQRSDVSRAFSNRAMIDNMPSVSPDELEVTKDDSKLVISASYSVRIPLFGNVSACLDFNPSSAK